MVAQHARRDEEKEQRRQLILDAALRLFASNAYHRVTMAGIAREVGLAKGTLYLYFATKESVFLQGLAQLRNEFYRELSRHLVGLEPLELGDRVEGYCREVSTAFWRADRFRRQMTLISSLLEEQLDVAELLENKRDAQRQFVEVATTLRRLFPELPADSEFEIVQQFRALVIGYSSVSGKGRIPACEELNEMHTNVQDYFLKNLRVSLSATLRYYLVQNPNCSLS